MHDAINRKHIDMLVADRLKSIKETIPASVTLVAVSKTHPVETILQAYQAGQRHFGENKVQELTSKVPLIPNDVIWHMIGHLQSNKVKYIAPFINLIHGVDSFKLLQVVNKEALKNNRIIDCLLQVHIAAETTKFGFLEDEIISMLKNEAYLQLKNIRICGLMGMATFTNNQEQVRQEFRGLKSLFDKLKAMFFNDDESFKILSMGMSDDYLIAIEEGSTLVRVGSAIFGDREYH